MATGYTHCVQTGEITSLREFALKCARAMGACIMMRDDPTDVQIPERFEPSDYQLHPLASAKTALAALLAMSDADCEQETLKLYQAELTYRSERNARLQAEEKNYRDMLAKVMAWETEAEGIRDFMIQQLESSIQFDCGHEVPTVVLQSWQEWKASKIEELNEEIRYREKAHAEEIERTESRNAWLAKLRASLPSE